VTTSRAHLRALALAVVVAAAAAARASAAPGDGERFVFVERTAAESGVDFVHRSGAPGAVKRFMIECVGAGVGLVDVDGDGDLDLYLVQGGDVTGDGGLVLGPRSRDALLLNDGDARFVDAGEAGGELGAGFGFGVTAADVDDDGDEDLLVTSLGVNELLVNDGDGRFARAADAGGLAGEAADWSIAAAFGDVDLDGDLDAYVTNYLHHDREHRLLRGKPCPWLGCDVPCGPVGLDAQPDRLHVNDGTGRFTDVTAAAGLGDVKPGYAFQPVFTDVEGDGDLDLFVANDSVANGFHVNLGPGDDGLPRFEERGLRSGLALSATGQAQAGMGVAVGDVDGDGRCDIVMTNFSREENALFLNASSAELGPMFFDESRTAGLGRGSYFDLGWGVCLLDAELDGDRDVFVANGHVYPQVDGCDISQLAFAQRNRLFEQVRPGRFAEATAGGGGLDPVRPSRGAAAGDLDGDGDVDLVVSEIDGPPTLLLNESPRRGSWIQLDLRPLVAAVGARVELRAGERRLVGEVRRGSSFASTEDRRLHFGVPADGEPLEAIVHWIGGARERFGGLRPGTVATLVRGTGER